MSETTMSNIGQSNQKNQIRVSEQKTDFDNFVLDKSIFSNIFEKDIRRVYIYKKSERLAKALLLIAPAFKSAHALRERLERISVGLIDASILPPSRARDALSHELLTLSSVLSIARTAGLLSPMNTELIGKEAHLLLKEIAAYEEPKLSFDDSPSLAALLKSSSLPRPTLKPVARTMSARTASPDSYKGQDLPSAPLKDNSERRSSIVSVLKTKGASSIKDISTIIRDVSEKTIQRELQNLVLEGQVTKTGERRWTTYTLVA
jgi:hypothetical protein